MSDLVFPFTGDFVRSSLIEGEPWFHFGDVCKILGLKNPSQSIIPIPEENKRKVESMSGVYPWFVDEEALWTIMLRCHGALDPESIAYRFRKWVVSVIKAIRTQGGYIAPSATPEQVQILYSTYQEQALSARELVKALPPDSPKIVPLVRNIKALDFLVKEEKRQQFTKVDQSSLSLTKQVFEFFAENAGIEFTFHDIAAEARFAEAKGETLRKLLYRLCSDRKLKSSKASGRERTFAYKGLL